MIRTDSGYARNLNWIFILFFTAIGLLALWQIRSILLLVFASVLLTIFATMPVRVLASWGINRGIAIILSMLGGVALVVLFILVVFPVLFEQFTVLATDVIPNGLQQFIELWNSGELTQGIPFIDTATIEDLVSSVEIDRQFIEQALTQISNALGQLGGSVVPLIGDFANGLLSILIVIFLCMYLIAEPDRYIRGIIILTPLWYRDRMREILERLDESIRAWVRVTGASMILVGLGTSIGLALLGIEQWAALGVLAGVLSFIPNFGTLVALLPSIAVAIIQAPDRVLLVFIVIYGVSFVQSQVVGPLLANESMKLAPILILIGQIVFGIFFGFLGIMLAVPMTAILVILVEEIYVRDILGDSGMSKPKLDDFDAMELEPSPD